MSQEKDKKVDYKYRDILYREFVRLKGSKKYIKGLELRLVGKIDKNKA